MELIKLIIERKIGLAESLHLTDSQVVINQILYSLDLVQHRMEMKWGIGRLQQLASDDLMAKWEAQINKLNDAIMNSDVEAVKELVAGCQRGWAVLEKSAVARGHVPYEPQFWEVDVDGAVYRVVRLREELEAIPEPLSERTVCLDELVRVFHARHQKTFNAEIKGSYVPSGKSMNERLDDV